MVPSSFSIEITEQGWLEGCLPEEDLCSHGNIRLVIGGQVITSGEGRGDYGIGYSALALLRTLEKDHSVEQPVAQQLIFDGCSTIPMMSCPIGVDWSVTHANGKVRIADVVRNDTTDERESVRYEGLAVELSEYEYRRQVVAFAEKAKELFEGVDKSLADDLDKRLHQEFWAEYDSILGRHTPSLIGGE